MKNKENPSSNPNVTWNALVAKEGITNPSNTRIRVEEQNLVGTKSPNHTGNGIENASIKESTFDWVQRRFGTPKEVLNVSLNHSCHEVPSQIFLESPKSTGATRGDRSLWSDEVQELEDNSEVNISIEVDDQGGNT